MIDFDSRDVVLSGASKRWDFHFSEGKTLHPPEEILLFSM
jgi:hypothetical protein